MDSLRVQDGVWLRPLEPTDGDDITAAVTDPDVVRWTRVPSPYSRADADAFIASKLTTDEEVATTFAVVLADASRADGRLVGVVGLEVEPRANTAEIGYWLASGERGRGIISRAAALVCEHGFDALQLDRIWLSAAVDNPASNAIAQRLGFSEEGIARSAHRYRDVDGTTTGRGDLRVWGLLPGELRA